MTTDNGASHACVVCGVEVRERALKSGPVWCSSGPGAHTICEKSPDYHHHPDLGPESGHTFRVSVECRGSSSVVGVEGHTDAEDFEPLPRAVEVRAWNLTDALSRAANRPLSDWFPDEDPSDNAPSQPS